MRFTRNNIVKNISLAVSILGMILGVFLSVKFNKNLPRIISPGISLIALADLEQKLEVEQAELKSKISNTDTDILAVQNDLKNRQNGADLLIETSDNLKKMAGLTGLTGEGAIIMLDDSNSDDVSANALTHASDLRDLVDYLWSTGVEAISIKGSGSPEERVGPNTSIDCIVNTILVNQTKMVPPFEIKVIGNREKIISAVDDKQALKEIYDRVENNKLVFYVDEKISQVSIPRYNENVIIKYAQIK